MKFHSLGLAAGIAFVFVAVLAVTEARGCGDRAWLIGQLQEEQDVICHPCTVPCANKRAETWRTYACQPDTDEYVCLASSSVWTHRLRDVTCVITESCGTACVTHPAEYSGVGFKTYTCPP